MRLNIGSVLGIRLPMRVVQIGTKTGHTFRGVMVEQTREVVILRAAMHGGNDPQTGQETWVRATGDIVIPWDNVDFWAEALDASLLE